MTPVFGLDRRSFLGIAGSALLNCGPGRAETALPAKVTVAYAEPGRSIALDFLGLSYESACVAAADYFAPENTSLLSLIRALGAEGVIRIGGNTSERTEWRRDAAPAPDRFTITPTAIDRLAAAVRALGWRLIYGLNLADNTPERAADEASYVAHALGPQLLAFQLGNEPDGFGRWSAVRPKSYDVASFLSEWRALHAAIRARVPGARFAGPDVAAQTDWVAPFAAMAPAGLELLTRHYYAMGPATDPRVTVAGLMHSIDQIEPVLDELGELSRAFRLPYRIAETNSVYAGGRAGVSDTFAAALWGVETMFKIAAAAGAGVNFHAGDDKIYTPIARAETGHRAQPLYYGLLLWGRFVRGVLVPVHVEAQSAIAAFAARDSDGGLRVCLINKDAGNARVRIDPGRRFAAASVIRLAAPSLDATSEVTLGGQAVDASGNWTPVHEVSVQDPALIIDVPGASAAVVVMDSASRPAQ